MGLRASCLSEGARAHTLSLYMCVCVCVCVGVGVLCMIYEGWRLLMSWTICVGLWLLLSQMAWTLCTIYEGRYVLSSGRLLRRIGKGVRVTAG